MPRFFFDLFEGHQSVMDSEGLLLAELEEAELEAAGAPLHTCRQSRLAFGRGRDQR